MLDGGVDVMLLIEGEKKLEGQSHFKPRSKKDSHETLVRAAESAACERSFHKRRRSRDVNSRLTGENETMPRSLLGRCWKH